MTEDELRQFSIELKRLTAARTRLDEINAEGKVLRNYIRDNEGSVAQFILDKQLQSCEEGGRRISVVEVTPKIAETPKSIYQALAEIYGGDDVIRKVKAHIADTHKPKDPEIRLKMVKKRKASEQADATGDTKRAK
jgi:hypothetical protein